MWREFATRSGRSEQGPAERHPDRDRRDGAGLDDFLPHLPGTMDRRRAGSSTTSPPEFFETIVGSCPGQFVFFHARHGADGSSRPNWSSVRRNAVSRFRRDRAVRVRPAAERSAQVRGIRWGRGTGTRTSCSVAARPPTTGYSATSGPSLPTGWFRSWSAAGCSTRTGTTAWWPRPGPRRTAPTARGWEPDFDFLPGVPAAAPRRDGRTVERRRWRWEVGSAYPLMLPSGNGPGLQPAGTAGSSLSAAGVAGPARVSGRQKSAGNGTSADLLSLARRSLLAHISDLLPVRRYDAGPLGPAASARRALGRGGRHVLLRSATGPAGDGGNPGRRRDPRSGRSVAGAGARRLLLRLAAQDVAVPDGGLLWFGTGRGLPSVVPPTEHHLATVSQILFAMCLKAAYRDGAPVTKDQFLPLYAARRKGLPLDAGEWHLGLLPRPSACCRRWRCGGGASERGGVGVRAAGNRRCPDPCAHLGVVLEFDTPERRKLSVGVWSPRNVYPGVFWDLRAPEAPPHQVDFSRRMLHLHTDASVWTRGRHATRGGHRAPGARRARPRVCGTPSCRRTRPTAESPIRALFRPFDT